MAKSNHTPGPWSYNENSPNRITAPSGETIGATYGAQLGFEQQVSNTKLISFAPIMYEYIHDRAIDGDSNAKSIVEQIDNPS